MMCCHFGELKDGIANGDFKGEKGDPGPGFTDTAKTLILTLFEGVAAGNSSMQTTLEALRREWGSEPAT